MLKGLMLSAMVCGAALLIPPAADAAGERTIRLVCQATVKLGSSPNCSATVTGELARGSDALQYFVPAGKPNLVYGLTYTGKLNALGDQKVYFTACWKVGGCQTVNTTVKVIK